MAIVKLNQHFIDRELRCPEGKKRVEYCCSELRGFLVEVRATNQGQGTYYLRYKDSAGQIAYTKLGITSETSVTAARAKAKQLKAEIQLGADREHRVWRIDASVAKGKRIPAYDPMRP